MSQKPSVGFIGLGLMGQAFTRRLVSRGYTVTGFDIVADKVEAAAAHGVVAARSPAEVTDRSDLVLVCVTSTDAVQDAVFGTGGVVEAAGADKVLVDHSTTVVESTRAMAEELRSRTGMGWVDAPVSGGPPAAEAGTLAIMAGGSDADIATVTPVMDEVADTFTHLGGVGAGQVTKMVNQILVLNNYCVLAEALALAEAAGIDAAKIPEALAPGHAGSNLLKSAFPRMIARDFEPAGYARQILKDLDMVHDIAKSLKVPTPMSSQAATLFRILVGKGHAEKDGIAVLKLYDQNDTV
ncbi:MAG: NAD-binding protein [Gammaproteobacteria bacterium]|nr:NAD(P)-dependent oxidoreductase [Gammaproteobacteria bacterium]NIS06522.1 NAD(P)-dependent oxidoreductase [Gammaproteobacteria bacterium]NIV47392.1 NAD-binding protein [Gammaproteobacteria bacterium]NIW02308.1 NAD-binding protein [Gammaproteobacteria bacterium]NIW55333.1 NAD-binding protein [Gammaproteobacteria bacterium]